jgi:hypothetical protein
VTYVRLLVSFDYWQSAYYHRIFRELLVTQRRLRRVEVAQRPAVAREAEVTNRLAATHARNKLPVNPPCLMRLAVR